MGDDGDRGGEPRPGRCVDRVLRRAAGPALLDPRHLARRDRPNMCRAHGANSLRYASHKHWGPITKAMRAIYTSPTVAAAEAQFEAFRDDWAATYPAMIRSWHNSWDEFVPFLEFPAELRRVVYTTNAIESLNARFPRAARHRGHSPQRASHHEDPLPRRHHQTQQPRQHDRQDQRLENHPQHTHHPLPRPHRRPHQMNTTTAATRRFQSVVASAAGRLAVTERRSWWLSEVEGSTAGG